MSFSLLGTCDKSFTFLILDKISMSSEDWWKRNLPLKQQPQERLLVYLSLFEVQTDCQMLSECLGGISSGLKHPCFIENLISIMCSASKNYFNSSHFEKLKYRLSDKMTCTGESLISSGKE